VAPSAPPSGLIRRSSRRSRGSRRQAAISGPILRRARRLPRPRRYVVSGTRWGGGEADRRHGVGWVASLSTDGCVAGFARALTTEPQAIAVLRGQGW
jgi:hypothetical protein